MQKDMIKEVLYILFLLLAIGEASAQVNIWQLPTGKESPSLSDDLTDVDFHNIRFSGDASQLKPSFFEGYDAEHGIGEVRLKDVRVNGYALRKKNLVIGQFVNDIIVK